GPPRGPEGPGGARPAESPALAPVPPRGAVGGAAAPHPHRAGLRRGRGGGAALLRDAIHPGPGPRRGPGRDPAAPRSTAGGGGRGRGGGPRRRGGWGGRGGRRWGGR